MTDLWIYKFLHVFFFEFVQNLPAVVVVVILLKFKKELNTFYKIAVAFAGCFLSVFLITTLEPYKVSVTTLATPSPTGTLGLLIFAVVFTVLALVAYKYLSSKFSSQRNDILVGVAFAVVTVIYEVLTTILKGDIEVATVARTISHSLAFLVSFPLTIALIKMAANKVKLLGILGGTLLATVIMTLVIVLIDYVPFIKT
jgi:hypothetical protein